MSILHDIANVLVNGMQRSVTGVESLPTSIRNMVEPTQASKLPVKPSSPPEKLPPVTPTPYLPIELPYDPSQSTSSPTEPAGAPNQPGILGYNQGEVLPVPSNLGVGIPNVAAARAQAHNNAATLYNHYMKSQPAHLQRPLLPLTTPDKESPDIPLFLGQE